MLFFLLNPIPNGKILFGHCFSLFIVHSVGKSTSKVREIWSRCKFDSNDEMIQNVDDAFVKRTEMWELVRLSYYRLYQIFKANTVALFYWPSLKFCRIRYIIRCKTKSSWYRWITIVFRLHNTSVNTVAILLVAEELRFFVYILYFL